MLGYDRSRFGEIDHLTPLGHLACYVVETSACSYRNSAGDARPSKARSGRHLPPYPFKLFCLPALRGPPVRDVAATRFALRSLAWRARSAAVSRDDGNDEFPDDSVFDNALNRSFSAVSFVLAKLNSSRRATNSSTNPNNSACPSCSRSSRDRPSTTNALYRTHARPARTY